MECITISSDEDEIQVISCRLAPIVKSELPANNQTPVLQGGEREPSQKPAVQSPEKQSTRQKDKESINGLIQFSGGVPVISLLDDGDEIEGDDKSDEEEEEVKSVEPRQLRISERVRSTKTAEPLKNGHKQDSSSSTIKKLDNGNSKTKKSLSKSSDTKGGLLSKNRDSKKKKEEVTLVSNEPLIVKLLETCKKVEYGAEMDLVERKIWNYFNSASVSKTHSPEFKTFLEEKISKIENMLNSTKDKHEIAKVIKECINEMKHDPNVVNGKLRYLYYVYEKLVKKIIRLEETEVETDEDDGNPYIYLDRYRKKVVEVYKKICNFEGRSTDADRPTKQRFFFAGSRAPIPIQRALERYYNRTKEFPDFYDVKKLVKKVNKEENLGLSENEVFNTAQGVFIEFGERLVCRRKYDDYNILVDYLKEGQCEDPADLDTELQMKLAENKRTRKKENEILDKYAMQDACSSKKSDTSTKENEKAVEEISTIDLTSSSSSSSSASTSSRESDDENSEKESKQKEEPLFSDSEEEFTILDVANKRKRLETNQLSSKRLKTDDELSSESDSIKGM